MNGTRQSSAELVNAIASDFSSDRVDVVVCPPAVMLADVAQTLSNNHPVALGAQDVSEEAVGAFTGEISAAMLMEFGVRYCIVGHSERRARHKESSQRVARKFVAARKAGLIPILCVGETEEERDANQTESVIAEQLGVVLETAGVESFGHAVIAYEPVWAIGSGKTASPEQADAVHAYLRDRVRRCDGEIADHLRIVYGGSMNAGNAADLLRCDHIDGGLIGGASLDADAFNAIIHAAEQA